MTRIVYYTEFNNQFSYEPELVLKSLKGYAKKSLLRCPAFTEHLKNTFLVNAVVDYELILEKERIYSPLRDQDFFDRWVRVRDVKEGACTFSAPQILFTSDKPLEMELKNATYHQNGFTDNATIIEGRYDIGRHFRPLESAFLFKDSKKVTVKQGQPLYYVRFNTNEKIKLVPFQYTLDIRNLVENKFVFKVPRFKPLSYWYDMHEKFYKKRLLKLIKESLL